ncbi:MAG: hypothetical protein KJ615_01395, partial [Bacteroidetes bacterium]|nr:hypothetical protein [Bacteroidota bacterium]
MLSFYYPRLILFALVTVLAGACSHSIQHNEPQTLAIDTIPLLPADSIYFDLDLPRIAQQQHRLDSTFNRLVRLTG